MVFSRILLTPARAAALAVQFVMFAEFATAAISITVSPASVTLSPSQKQSYTATVSGTTQTNVTWSISPAVGTLSTAAATAVYTAPATLTAAQTITLKAVSIASPTVAATAIIKLTPAPKSTPAVTVSVTLAPAGITLSPSQAQSYAAAVSGTTQTGVTWSISPSVGALSSTNTTAVYTAPTSITTAQTITLKATSIADSTKSAAVTVSLAPPIAVTLTPASSNLNPGQTQSYSAKVTGTSNTNVTWSLSPAIGTLSTTSGAAVYIAPAVVTAAQAVTIKATSASNSTKAAAATVNLIPQVKVQATPAAATLYASRAQQFTASVSGTTNQTVTWSVSPAVGTVSSTGLYKAPASVTSKQAVTLTAKSAANTSSIATVQVVLDPGQLQFTVNSNGLSSLSLNGQSYYLPVSPVVSGVMFRSPAGAVAQAASTKPSSATSAGNSFTQVYNAGGGYSYTVKGTFAAYDAQTVEADFSITNNDPVSTITQYGFTNIGVNLPGPWTQGVAPVGTPQIVNQYNGVPVTFLSGAWGSVAMWLGAAPATATQLSFFNAATQTQFGNCVHSYSVYGPNTYATPLPPGQTQTYTQFVRFGTSTDTAATLAPEAFAAYRALQPYTLNWPDRRPIGQWMIADAYNGRSATNPRGYLWNKTLNIANASQFQTAVLTAATGVISRFNAMSPKPQGVIIWDLEGQEFAQSFTYVGYPNNLPSLAPEMDAIADQVMAMFTSAGYRVGVTVRPQYFGVGNTLPLTCSYNTNVDFADKFIDLSAIYPYRGYYCTAPNVWSAAKTANYPNEQVEPQDYNTMLNQLVNKVSYANQRWAATLFYIDSSVWEGGTPLDGSIIRSLQAKFPNFLFIPEESTDLTFSAAAPLEQAAAFGYFGTNQRTRNLYPNAFGVVNMASADWTDNYSTLVQAVVNGDVLMFEGWFNAPEIPVVQQIYAAAGVQ